MSIEPDNTEQDESSPIIALVDDARPLVVGPQQLTVLAGAATGSPVGMVDYRIAPGFSPPPYLHRHTREDAGWVVLDGTVEFHLEDGSVITAEAGSSFVHPRGCWFRWRNPHANQPARALCWFSPAGFERFFVELAEAARAHLDDGGSMETFAPRLAELRHRYGLEPRPDASVPGQVGS